MGTWHEYLNTEGTPPEWPYPIKFGEESELEADVLVLGGGIAGCWAAINAARQGVKVVLMEKGDVKRSGAGGPGCDHWCNVPANPLSRADPDEWAEQEAKALGRYSNGIGVQIQCREDFDTLLEMEQMGGKIRDTDDEFLGVEGRDDKTKFMVSPRYTKSADLVSDAWNQPGFSNPPDERKNTVLRIWGSTFKPVLKKECLRLGVKVLDRVMATSLLNDGGKQGARVVGATGINVRTGEFIIVKAKSTIIATAAAGQLWHMDMEQGGYSTMYSRNASGDGTAMAFRAGASVTMMEGSGPVRFSGGLRHKWYTGGADASYENVPLVDADNQVLPAPTQGWADAGTMLSPDIKTIMALREGVKTGKYKLPFYADFAGMKPEESHATWDLMLTEESTTKVMVQTMRDGGFDPQKDQIMNYSLIEFQGSQQFCQPNGGGGLMVDWDLKNPKLDGLYIAGTSMFTPGDHSFAAATGRYAGRKAAAYAKSVSAGEACRKQIDKEKERVLAPTKREGGIEWKELHNGLCRVMQYFVSEFKSELLLDMALDEIHRIEENAVPQLYALDPHKLMRSLEDLSMIDYAKIMIYAMKERRLSNFGLHISRVDYPESSEDANNFLALYMENDEVKFERVPLNYWGNMKEGYEAHNRDYTGVYKPEN